MFIGERHYLSARNAPVRKIPGWIVLVQPTIQRQQNQLTNKLSNLTSLLCPLARGLRTRYETKETSKGVHFRIYKRKLYCACESILSWLFASKTFYYSYVSRLTRQGQTIILLHSFQRILPVVYKQTLLNGKCTPHVQYTLAADRCRSISCGQPNCNISTIDR